MAVSKQAKHHHLRLCFSTWFRQAGTLIMWYNLQLSSESWPVADANAYESSRRADSSTETNTNRKRAHEQERSHQANPHIRQHHIVWTTTFRSGLPGPLSSQTWLDKGWGNPDRNGAVQTIWCWWTREFDWWLWFPARRKESIDWGQYWSIVACMSTGSAWNRLGSAEDPVSCKLDSAGCAATDLR